MSLMRTIRRSFAEFLAVPVAIVAAFLLLAAGTTALDRAEVAALAPARRVLSDRLFADPRATSSLLGEVAGSLITVTSITLSILLLAVQQAAASMTSQVIDQFLRRGLNRVFFGFFVGLALYALIILATVREGYNPVFGATLALASSVVALIFLILLIYATIHQTRSEVVIAAIHRLALSARERQLALLRRTRRASRFPDRAGIPVPTVETGFVTDIDLTPIAAALTASPAAPDLEVVLLVAIGSAVAFGDPIAEIRGDAAAIPPALAAAVRRAVRLEPVRDPTHDPDYGIEQLATIAWTSISTSKQNPAPGLRVIYALRDLLARWTIGEEEAPHPDPPLPIVYRDALVPRLMDAFESLAVVASEAMQHQTFAAVVRALTAMLPRLPAAERDRTADVARRILAGLGDLVLTADLDEALTALATALTEAGHPAAAADVERARAALAASIGSLNSRSTRVPTDGQP